MDSERTDRELVQGVREADAVAFRLLFERHQPMLFRVFLATVRDVDQAHDIVQETFTRIWVHRSRLDPERPILAYALRIGRNLVRDAARRRSVRDRHMEDLPTPAMSAGDDPEEALQVSMLQDRLAEVIANDLPERCRIVFVLSRIEGMSTREIAAHLRLSPKTVENQIGHALKVLRKRLAGELGE